jgi:hypothetical protein
MKSILRRLVIHPFAFAIFPILALLSYNITEIALGWRCGRQLFHWRRLVLILLITLVTGIGKGRPKCRLFLDRVLFLWTCV